MLCSHFGFPVKNAPTYLVTDASNVAAEAVLYQKIDGEFRPLAFLRRGRCSLKYSYSVFDKKLIAMYMAVKHFKCFLERPSFKGLSLTRKVSPVLSSHILLAFHEVKVGLLRNILLTSFIFQVQRMLLPIACPGLNAMHCLRNFFRYLCMRWRLNNKLTQVFQAGELQYQKTLLVMFPLDLFGRSFRILECKQNGSLNNASINHLKTYTWLFFTQMNPCNFQHARL